MFDVSFTELLVIAVVALVVIGPERLPRVARTVGHLMGRAQRYVTDVKREIRQELDAADQATGGLMALRKEVQESAQEIAQLGQDITTSAGKISQDISEEFAPVPEGCSEQVERQAGAADRDGMQGANRSNGRSHCEDLQRGKPPESADARGAGTCSEHPETAEQEAAPVALPEAKP